MKTSATPLFRLAALLCGALTAPAFVGSAMAEPEIVRLADRKPERSPEREPSAAALAESWLSGYGFEPGHRYDVERYEVLERRIVWQGRAGRALLRLRVLGPEGDAMALATARCPGRSHPIEAQILLRWSEDPKGWYPSTGRSDPALKPCADEPLWSDEQATLVVDPPPLPAPPKVSKAEVTTPAPGTPERKAIMDALRPGFEALFGQPIQFKVNELRVAAGFAWASVHPQRPDGRDIPDAEWAKALDGCEQLASDGSAQFWMRRIEGRWTIGWGRATGVCATDSIADFGYLIGAPPQLLDRDDWGETDFMPVDDPQYFELWRK